MMTDRKASTELATTPPAAELPKAGPALVPGRIIRQAQHGLTAASETLRALADDADPADFEVNLRPTATITATTAAEALASASRWCEKQPDAEIHAIGIRRLEDAVGTEYELTLAFSYPEDEE